MKNIFKYSYLALVGMVALLVASCSDSYKYDGRGTWDATDGYANIYFEITDSTLELDPADPTNVIVKVSRRNAQGALTVPFEIKENTDDVFTVSEASFADGQEETEITLSFPKAEIGKPYTLSIMLSDPELVSKYSEGAIYTIEVTRVKWNDVGFYYKDADKKEKVEGYAMYTDDFMCGIFSTGNPTYPVKVQERDDQKGIFRVINAYGEDYPYNDPGDWDASKDYYMIINASNPEKVYISPANINLGLDWGYGYVHVLCRAGDYVEAAEEAEATGDAAAAKEYLSKAEDFYGKYENGKITFPAQSFYIGMEDYNDGKWGWYANPNGAFSLVIDPDKDLHNADMTSDEDFTWEEVFAGIFKSGKLGTTTEGVKLYKGTCINTEGECDKRFAEEYGTAYMIESPYANGYNLYFAVNERGEVTLPEDLKLQDTGTKAVGEEVYAAISTAASTFTERVVTLKIAFQTEPDEDGNYMEYGSAEEVLSYITWTKIGTGDFTYTFLYTDYDEETDTESPLTDEGLDIYQRDDQPTTYKVEPWGEGGEFLFTWDGKDKVTVPASFTGSVYPGYGAIYVSDVPTCISGESYSDNPCTYDAETKTFTFTLKYFIPSAGVAFNGVAEETLKITSWGTTDSRKNAATKRTSAVHARKNLKLANGASRFGTGKKVNVKSKNFISSAQLEK